MKQFQFAYQNEDVFLTDLAKIQQWCDTNPSYTKLFRIYSDDSETLRHIAGVLDTHMPEALYLGCTTHANLLDGTLTEAATVVTCTVFEYETTQVRLLQFPFSEEDASEAVHKLQAFCDANPWVSAVEMHATILEMSVQDFCKEMCALRSDIQMFGAGACNASLMDLTTTVFSKGNDFSTHGIVFLLLGGSDFHAYSMYVSGWTPLRRKFRVTKANRETLYELDGEPAFRVYQRFLGIENNDALLANTLEFPILIDRDGTDIMRSLLYANDDGSVVMTSEIDEGCDVRLAYGDPEMILASVKRNGQNIANFQPEVIQAFSCGARRLFWGDDSISDETSLFRDIASTSGFYTGGEFLRLSGVMHHFNCTLVLAAMREGDPKGGEIVNLYDANHDDVEGVRITLLRRFISFIEASTADFEALAQKLEITSVTDGLTSLYNRTEIEHRIRTAIDEQTETSGSLSLIMLDIDNFKKVNDTYGHKEGDQVIIALSDVLRKVLGDVDAAYIGRWGGEEFMALLPDSDMDEALELAEKIRVEFASVTYEFAKPQTVSIGVSQSQPGETSDTLCSRVDKALYTAKAAGKNQVVQM